MESKQSKDYTDELYRTLQAIQDKPCDPSLAEQYWNICCCCVATAEYYHHEHTREWQIARLCNILLRYADCTFRTTPHAYPIYRATARMCELLYEHPRLQLQLYKLHMQLLQFYCPDNEKEIEKQKQNISTFEHNIACADAGKYEDIIPISRLKHDPLEWTSQWEEVIDMADEMTYSEMGSYSRRMGFCHLFWSTRRHILYTRFQLEWRSPAAMNPKVLFD